MIRRRQRREPELEGASWPGVADMLLAALMMTMLFWIGSIAADSFRIATAEPLDPNKPTPGDLLQKIKLLEESIGSLESENARLLGQVGALTSQIKAAERELASARSERDRLMVKIEEFERRLKKPPIIEIDDVQELNFASGSAIVSESFQRELEKKYFPRFAEVLGDYTVVDTIEIIGHTDQNSVGGKGDFDLTLPRVQQGAIPIKRMEAGSNADLGLMRALTIRDLWKRWLAQRQIVFPREIEVRCYSAAFGVMPSNPRHLHGAAFDEISRRIEIRFTSISR